MEAGTLTEVNRVWQLRGPAVVPSGLAALLDDRLEHAGSDVVNALKLLALCEPLDIDALCELAGEDAVDTADPQGRFSLPLFADVVRGHVGTASARKLRGRIAGVQRDRVLDTAASRIRLAQLCVDSDQPVDTDLLITAPNTRSTCPTCPWRNGWRAQQ